MIPTDHSTSYVIQSPVSDKTFTDDNWLLEIPGEEPSLLRSKYAENQLILKGSDFGLYTFASWLPLKRMLKGSSAPVTYKSSALASYLGLENLYITFSGYWPEKGAMMRSCSFKETEAYSVSARLDASCKQVLVVASAGNTARSFARVCSDNNIPLLICIPEDNLNALWFDQDLADCVKVVATRTGGDYFDAIHLSNLVCKIDGFIAEGGAKNIARRDGMATTVLSAVTTIGKIPDYYFQAVGSGTGAIAAWEANLRLLEDGRFGNTMMKLMLSQNEPFHPIYDAWKVRSRAMLPMDDLQARKDVEQIIAKVLSNRRPPYSIKGGLYDALVDTNGEIFLVSNDECRTACELFKTLEGNDIHPAAAVALASLIEAVHENKVPLDATIMLNITGGGEERFSKEFPLHFVKPNLIFDIDPDFEVVKKKLEELFNQ